MIYMFVCTARLTFVPTSDDAYVTLVCVCVLLVRDNTRVFMQSIRVEYNRCVNNKRHTHTSRRLATLTRKDNFPNWFCI